MTTLRPDKGFICNVTTFRAKHTKHTQARAVARFFVTGGGGGGGIIATYMHEPCMGVWGCPPPTRFSNLEALKRYFQHLS